MYVYYSCEFVQFVVCNFNFESGHVVGNYISCFVTISEICVQNSQTKNPMIEIAQSEQFLFNHELH